LPSHVRQQVEILWSADKRTAIGRYLRRVHEFLAEIGADFDIPDLVFLPGAIRYRGCRVPLKGYPWRVLKELAHAPGRTVTINQLTRNVWDDPRTEEQTVQQAISRARKAVRTALRNTHTLLATKDPIPAVSHGGGDILAWKLVLP
jgi:DNA-binding response OmpR family regulator